MDRSASQDQASARSQDNLVVRIIEPAIAKRPWTIVILFLLVTVIFIAGLGADAEQQAGADQFTEDLEEFQAYEAMQDDFDRASRDSGGTSAQLFVTDPSGNVLSKDSLLRMLETQDRLETSDDLRISSTTSPGTLIAQQIDPTAQTPEDHYRVIDRATQRQLDAAIEATADSLMVSTDFSPATKSADVTQIAISYQTPPMADSAEYASLQYQTLDEVDTTEGYEVGENVIILADAFIQDEVLSLLNDTAIVVFPAAIILILFFLLVAYRDPIDLILGLSALLMTMVWTFGFMGYANIPFSDSLITVFPLLLAVGIDFGIHIINRYREERIAGGEIGSAMQITTRQLAIAFLIVTVTTVFSFMSNLISELEQLQHFAVVAAFGMISTFLLFGIFLPAGKVGFDRLRAGTRFPQFGTKPLGREGSVLGRILEIGTAAARKAPYIVLAIGLVIGATAGAYGTGVDATFDQEAFFPDEDRIEQYQQLPAPFAPDTYHFMAALAHLEDDFEIPFIQTVTIYIDDRAVRSDMALVDIDQAIRNPPPEFERADRRAQGGSILEVISSEAETNPEFDGTVRRYDSSGDGVPDRNVDQVYDALFASESQDDALTYLTSDRRATRIELQPDVDAEDAAVTAAAEDIAADMRLDAVATGDHIINQAVIDRITASSVNSLLLAFILTALFLVLTYWWLEGRAMYGLINLIPILLTVALLAGSMRYFDIPLSPINAPILAVSIGLGVDYTVHFMHRFVDEFEARNDIHEALLVTTRGTGGALTGSMLTTVTGLGVLALALIPLIVEFGILLALGVFYAYATTILFLPSIIVAWDGLATNSRSHVPL